MHLLHRLPGKRADPTSSPSENTGAKQRSEEPWNGVLEPSRHHANAGEDQAAKADDSPGVYRKSLESSHQCLCPRKVHRSLGLSDVRKTRKREGNECRSQNAQCVQ